MFSYYLSHRLISTANQANLLLPGKFILALLKLFKLLKLCYVLRLLKFKHKILVFYNFLKKSLLKFLVKIQEITFQLIV